MCTTTVILHTCANCGKEICRRLDRLTTCPFRMLPHPSCTHHDTKYRTYTKLCSRCHPACACFTDEELAKILGTDVQTCDLAKCRCVKNVQKTNKDEKQ
ncbi:hypothetical protein CkaCkLH20_09574 [Colletotrichum karsti]|uniref:Uncharacterized protein n=1 Tax=Colletotrichum karsti TaxID=1095194 RepID=A0A9P6HYT5_9PEZI|nr:uncharacterized protein CkaCkLH20_09574 [Colletotrichum karsti]KAF9873064.1 hypothetical protein CkaCkLH20_09574 [Colletotrichum karsti]